MDGCPCQPRRRRRRRGGGHLSVLTCALLLAAAAAPALAWSSGGSFLQSHRHTRLSQQCRARARQGGARCARPTSLSMKFQQLEDLKEGVIKNDPEWQFFDVAKINVKGGDGGDGCVAFRREKGIAFGGPSGGSGGDGGSIILRCDKRQNTLSSVRNKVHHKATKGQTGQGKSRHGTAGKGVVVTCPPGTVVRDEEGNLCGELKEEGQEMVVAKGGRGGRGNEAFKTSRNIAPKLGEVGEPGAERWLNLELKLIADVGLVGVPNAGKSTLLGAISNARPKIADYPFTTVTPNLGVCDSREIMNEGEGVVLADIPGLLEGAHSGTGLGIAFLRHVQRCRVILHIVNGESLDPVGDYKVIMQELELFNPKLLEKPQVVVLNKIDLPHVRARQEELSAELKAVLGHTRFMAISAVAKENTTELMRRVRKLLDATPPPADLFEGEERRDLGDESDEEWFKVESDPAYPGQFRIVGPRIQRIARMTSWDYYEAVVRFQRILDAMGISAELKRQGAEDGDLIMINDVDFDYSSENAMWENLGDELY